MKKKIGILSFVAIFVALLTLSVSAVTVSEFSSDSTFKPVSYSTYKSISSVTLYGNVNGTSKIARVNNNKESKKSKQNKKVIR